MFFKRKNEYDFNKLLEINLLDNIKQFDLFDETSKQELERTITAGITPQSLKMILWDIFNEYNNVYSELKKLKSSNAEMIKFAQKYHLAKQDIIDILSFTSNLDEETSEAINTNETMLQIMEKYDLLPCEICGCFCCLCQPCMYKEMEASDYI